jgi:hypothetical protein
VRQVRHVSAAVENSLPRVRQLTLQLVDRVHTHRRVAVPTNQKNRLANVLQHIAQIDMVHQSRPPADGADGDGVTTGEEVVPQLGRPAHERRVMLSLQESSPQGQPGHLAGQMAH